MDSMILYPSIGIVILILVIAVTLKYDAGKVKTKEEKQAEILQKYKEDLHSALSNIDDNEEKKTKKTKLLKQFSDELSRNIFFDADEIRDVIRNLTKL